MHSVFKEWLFELPYRMQSVLASSLRGCDIAKKDDNSKFITRALRGLILNNADTSNTFIVGDGTVEEKYVTGFLWDLDAYPMHFLMHTAHAAEIVGYKHPDAKMRSYWIDFYQKMCKGFHLNAETEAQLDVRLSFTPSERGELREESIAERPLELDIPETKSATVIPITPTPQVAAKPIKKPAKKPDPKWDAGTGTSHGGRQREYSGGS